MDSETPTELQAELLDDFYAECDEHLRTIREAVVLLEASVGKAQADAGVLEELFRQFHSLKGICAIVGLRPAEELAHAAEDYLRELTRGRLSLTSPGFGQLMGAAQKMEQLVGAFRTRGDLPESASMIASLRGLAGQGTPARSASQSEDSAAGVASSEGESSPGLVLWRCTFVPSRELDQRGVNLSAVRTRLTQAGEILRSTSKVRGEGVVEFEFVLGTRETPPDIAHWERDGISVRLVESGADEAQLPTLALKLPVEPAPSPFIAPSHVVRVDLHRLDELMRITGEMVVHRSRLDEQLTRTRRGQAQALDSEAVREVNTALARSLRELREAIMRVRLVPVAEIFARLPFVVKDLARDTGKQVRLSLEGQQTELDKYLIERLKDPLLHLVRNAFSHGVEGPEERVAAGKPPEGLIVLGASTKGDSVLIQVRDDGRGIDGRLVARRATALGMAVPEPLDEAAVLRILCAHGFSTREDADRTSGRGVGMAAVYNTVRELGGSIFMRTALGKGTEFSLRLPLTLAILEAFIVAGAGQVCAVPQSFVREVLQIETRVIRVVNQVEVVPYRSGVLPLIRLSGLFGKRPEAGERMYLLVVNSERGSAGLMVDRIHGHREVVVRAIRDPLVQVPGVIGATELGDGRPVLILDGAVLTGGAVRPPSTVWEKDLAAKPAAFEGAFS